MFETIIVHGYASCDMAFMFLNLVILHVFEKRSGLFIGN